MIRYICSNCEVTFERKTRKSKSGKFYCSTACFWKSGHMAGVLRERAKDNIKFADCHSDKKHYGLGLCLRCYSKKYKNQQYVRERTALAYKTRPVYKNKDIRLKSRYGISLDDYNSMWSAQQGLCKICEKGSERGLMVDHDHSSGKVRGLLCNHCNLIIGWAKDSVDVLVRAVEYLKNNNDSTT